MKSSWPDLFAVSFLYVKQLPLITFYIYRHRDIMTKTLLIDSPLSKGKNYVTYYSYRSISQICRYSLLGIHLSKISRPFHLYILIN
jgi:hypothetical protein